MFASAHSGEKAKDVIKHLLMAFSMLGMPRQIKTDNGLGYVLSRLRNILHKWGGEHATGIPHSPTGQVIMERAHQTLKRLLHQQQGGPEEKMPIVCLCKSLFTINF